MDKEGDFRSYNGEAWIITISHDKKNWWANRLIGFIKIIDEKNPTYDYWYACYLENGGVYSVKNNECDIIFDRKPTEEDARNILKGYVIDPIGGNFEEENEKTI